MHFANGPMPFFETITPRFLINYGLERCLLAQPKNDIKTNAGYDKAIILYEILTPFFLLSASFF